MATGKKSYRPRRDVRVAPPGVLGGVIASLVNIDNLVLAAGGVVTGRFSQISYNESGAFQSQVTFPGTVVKSAGLEGINVYAEESNFPCTRLTIFASGLFEMRFEGLSALVGTLVVTPGLPFMMSPRGATCAGGVWALDFSVLAVWQVWDISRISVTAIRFRAINVFGNGNDAAPPYVDDPSVTTMAPWMADVWYIGSLIPQLVTSITRIDAGLWEIYMETAAGDEMAVMIQAMNPDSGVINGRLCGGGYADYLS